MAKIVSIKNIGKEIKEFGKLTLENQKSAVVKGVVDSLSDLIANSPVDTGQYANSWDISVEETKVILGNFAPHAAIIEFGARPFKPPITPLLQWAKRVLGDPSQPPNYSNHVWALAKYTQGKIEREGMKPKHILEKAIPGIIDNIKQEVIKSGKAS